MKIKLLLPPLLIAFIIIMSIWVVYPEYKLMTDQETKLVAREKTLEELKEKNAKMDKLAASLSANSADRAMILDYLPVQMQEEILIATLNSMAESEGLKAYNLSPVSEAQNSSRSGSSKGAAGAKKDNSIASKISIFNMRVGLSGSYEKLRNFTAKLTQLKRFNRFTQLDIGQPRSIEGEDANVAINPSDLQLSAVVNFAFLQIPEMVEVDLESSLLKTGSFSTSIIDQVRLRSTALSSIGIGNVGKENPFAP